MYLSPKASPVLLKAKYVEMRRYQELMRSYALSFGSDSQMQPMDTPTQQHFQETRMDLAVLHIKVDKFGRPNNS